MQDMLLEARDFRVQDLARFFEYEHLQEDLKPTSQQFHDLAANLIHDLPDSEELLVGLRKLMEAKDCFVRATVAARGPRT